MSSTHQEESEELPIRYLNIEGLPDKFNNVIYTEPFNQTNETSIQNENEPDIVCFFGGDIQNFRAEMSDDHARFVENYCLESIATKLRYRFPSSIVVTVQPVLQHQRTFSRYNNFLRTVDSFGTPEYVNNVNALNHFDRLIGRIVDDRQQRRQLSSSKSTITSDTKTSTNSTETNQPEAIR